MIIFVAGIDYLINMKAEHYFIWSCVGYEDTEFPELYCPVCNGILAYDRESFTRIETPDSSPGREEYIISCRFCCNDCRNQVIMTGSGYNENYMYGSGVYYDPGRILYVPSFFNPAIYLFQIPQKCPGPVKKEIERSFSLFWDDVHSCVNKLRLAVELLMDAHKIHKTAVSRKPGKPRSRLTLHKRIELFKKKNQKVGEILEAIKWIGNKGSHADKQLLVNEAMDAYELLEHALNELYQPKSDVFYDLARLINKKKGVRYAVRR